MAEVNSIVMGKASGKLGNIVFSRGKSKVIAKQAITPGVKKSSPLMITKQQKLTNTYAAWNYIMQGKAGFKKYMNYKENYYNFFVRAFNNVFPAGVRLQSREACQYLIGQTFGYSPFIQFSGATKIGTKVRVNFKANRNIFPAYAYILVQVWSSNVDGTRIIQRYFTVNELNQGFADFEFINDIWTGCMVYAYRKKHDFTSEIKFYAL